MLNTRSRKFSIALITLAITLSTAGSALAATSFDFVSSGGQFAIFGNTLSFGNGLTISAASVNGVDDTSLTGVTIILDAISLDGSVTNLPGGIAQVGITSQDYTFSIFQSAGDGGALLLSGIYDPGDFLVIGASGLISAPIADAISSLVLTPVGMGFSSVLTNLVSTTEIIDLNIALSAAGQDIAARIQSGSLVAGAVAGSVATVIPEPSTAVMMGLGLGGLALVSRRQLMHT